MLLCYFDTLTLNRVILQDPFLYQIFYETSLFASKKFQYNLPAQTISKKQIQGPRYKGKIYKCPKAQLQWVT